MHPGELQSKVEAALALSELAALAPPSIPGISRTTGVWTPTDASGAGLVLTVYSAVWTRWDNLVFARFAIAYPGNVDVSSALIGGLPFDVPAVDAQAQGGISYYAAAILLQGFPDSAQRFQLHTAPSGANATNAQLSGAYIQGWAMYETP